MRERYAPVVDRESTRGDHRGSGWHSPARWTLPRTGDAAFAGPRSPAPLAGGSASDVGYAALTSFSGTWMNTRYPTPRRCRCQPYVSPSLLVRETPAPRNGKSTLEHDVHIRLIRQRREARLAVRSWRSVLEPLHTFLQKPLYPFVDVTTAHANCSGNVGDRHPVSKE